MKRITLILILLFTGYVSGVSCFGQEGQEGEKKTKKAVMIIAQEGFRDEELSEPSEILKRNGIEVKVASTSLAPAEGMMGAKVKPDILISNINAADFDAVVFIGGVGASQYWDDPIAHNLAKSAFNKNKIVAAICLAPVTLAKAGILKGKRATVWSTEKLQLRSFGANYTGLYLERDGNIITASGPTAASEFGNELVKALLNR
jgi:protease I